MWGQLAKFLSWNFIKNMIIQLLLDKLTDQAIDDFVAWVKGTAIPWLHAKKTDLFNHLRSLVLDPDNSFTDELIDKAEKIVDAFMPDNPTHL